MKNFIFFPQLKTLISQSKLNVLSSRFCENIHIFRVEKDSAIKKWGHRQCWGGHFWRLRTLRGKMGVPHEKKVQNFWLNIFLKPLCEKSNTFQPILNIYFRAFSDWLSFWSLVVVLGIQTHFRERERGLLKVAWPSPKPINRMQEICGDTEWHWLVKKLG